MVMIFAHPKVRAYLLKHGLVYTFRKYHKKTPDGIRPQVGRDWATDKRCGEKIANIKITPIKAVGSLNIEQVLAEYVSESGFATGFLFLNLAKSVKKWMQAIEDLNTGEIPQGWIYKVEILEAEG